MKKIFFVCAGVSLVVNLCFVKFLYLSDLPNGNSRKDFNIVLITIDTLRADHLYSYDYYVKTSPNIDRFAEKGIRFSRALAPSSWTAPSMASIMTSLYPVSHGVNSGIVENDEVFKQEILDDKFETLAEIVRKDGYTTFGAVANIHMTEDLGFDQGFDYYYSDGFDDASEINKVVFSWKKDIRESKKVFLWVHYFDPHDPYFDRKPWIDEYAVTKWKGRKKLPETGMEALKELIPIFKKDDEALDYLIALYDSEISYVDSHMGFLLKNLGLEENTLLIITSDHGDEFLDHDSLGHGHTLYKELVHVPFIMNLPFSNYYQPGRVIDKQVSLIDIMPTVLDAAGIEIPDNVHGKSLLDPLDRVTGVNRDYLFFELSKWTVSKGVQNDKWKYIYNYCTQREELYDLSRDPAEVKNLVKVKPAIAKKLKEAMFDWASSAPRAPSIRKTINPSQEIEDQLKALGYITEEKKEEMRYASKSCGVKDCH